MKCNNCRYGKVKKDGDCPNCYCRNGWIPGTYYTAEEKNNPIMEVHKGE
jgi:hypothetical protein